MRCHVLGRGRVTVIRNSHEQCFAAGTSFAIDLLGSLRWPAAPQPLPPALVAQQATEPTMPAVASPAVMRLVADRQEARACRDWFAADALRQQIVAMGWQVKDTPNGPELIPVE